MLTQNLPYPPTSGGALRAYGLLHSLHANGHKLTLLSFHNGRKMLAPALDRLCTSVIAIAHPTRTHLMRLQQLLLTMQPDIVQRMSSEQMCATLAHQLRTQTYDAVLFEGLEMATYLPYARTLKPGAKLIYDAFNAEYALQRTIARVDARNLRRLPAAIYSRVQAARIHAYERSICEMADGVIAVSKEDAALLRPLRGKRPLSVVPSGIFAANYDEAAPLALEQPALVFTGKMDYRPNVDAVLWFADEILPRLKGTIPDLHFYIVGQKPSAALEPLQVMPDVVVTGAVEDVQPYLHGAAVYVAPLRMGSGTRLKLLEAMASGCAIVATSLAAAGLSDDVRQALRIADDPEAFAETILALLNAPDERVRLGEEARTVVRQHYDWAAIAPQLVQALKDFGLG
ncbi:MAG: glycosyltransferase [Anaerolineae bacterium]|nr:glycosyltransferase [Anaerolineae bacterium]